MGENKFLRFLKAWHGVRRFKKLPRPYRRLVFYSEGREYWPHLGPLVKELVEHHDFPVTCVSSSPDDPCLTYRPDKVQSFYIGFGAWCTLWFVHLDIDVLVMTMPDLETYHIKRSKSAPVHYVYVQHAPVSSHMMYREEAFDNFDTIFISGPHQKAEIRRREKMCALRPKHLFAHGYCRLDDLLKEQAHFQRDISKYGEAISLKVTIAPSWGDGGIFDSCGHELIRILLENGFDVTFRPHPQSRRMNPHAIAAYAKEFGDHLHFKLDVDALSTESLALADVLITDWSGIAYDYAFLRKEPVLFVDTPRKVKNPNYENLSITPMEVAVREEIGEILKPDRLQNAPAIIRRLVESRTVYAERCEKALHQWIYNVGMSASAGAAELIRIVEAKTTRNQ